MCLPGTFRLQKPIIITALVMLIFFTWEIYAYAQGPEAKSGLLVLPVFGWLLFAGLMIWYLLEKDTDRAWIKKLDKYKTASQSQPVKKFTGVFEWTQRQSGEANQDDKDSPSPQRTAVDPENSLNISVNLMDEIELPELDGVDVPYWKALLSGFALYFGLSTFFNESLRYFSASNFSFSLWISAVGCLVFSAFYFLRHRSKSKYRIANCRRIDANSAKYRDSNFYQYFSQQAYDLGFTEIGDFKELGFQRTAFTSTDGAVLLEIGTKFTNYCFQIKTLSSDCKLMETSSLSSFKAFENYYYYVRQSTVTDSLSAALELHAKATLESGDRELSLLKWTADNLQWIHNHRCCRKRMDTPWGF